MRRILLLGSLLCLGASLPACAQNRPGPSRLVGTWDGLQTTEDSATAPIRIVFAEGTGAAMSIRAIMLPSDTMPCRDVAVTEAGAVRFTCDLPWVPNNHLSITGTLSDGGQALLATVREDTGAAARWVLRRRPALSSAQQEAALDALMGSWTGSVRVEGVDRAARHEVSRSGSTLAVQWTNSHGDTLACNDVTVVDVRTVTFWCNGHVLFTATLSHDGRTLTGASLQDGDSLPWSAKKTTPGAPGS